MKQAAFVPAQLSGAHHYAGTRENRDVPQREKLEETILNMAGALGFSEVQRASLAGPAWGYALGNGPVQSASNLILEMSRTLIDRKRKE